MAYSLLSSYSTNVNRKPKNLLISSQGWMPQLVFSICWNNKEVVNSNASEGINVLKRLGQEDKEQKHHSFMSLYRLPGKSVFQINVVSSSHMFLSQDVCVFLLQDIVRLFPPCLKVREFGGFSEWLTSVATRPDTGCGYLVLLTLRWLIQVDPFHPDRWPGCANILLLLLL